MGARSRRKGASWEPDVAAMLEAATGLPFRRVLTERRDGNIGDVDAPRSALVVQAKVGARPDPFRALREAVDASRRGEPGRLPVAIVRRNGAGARPPEDLAVLRLADFLALLVEQGNGRFVDQFGTVSGTTSRNLLCENVDLPPTKREGKEFEA